MAIGELARLSGRMLAAIHWSNGRMEPSEPNDSTSRAAASSGMASSMRRGWNRSPASQNAKAASVAPSPVTASTLRRS